VYVYMVNNSNNHKNSNVCILCIITNDFPSNNFTEANIAIFTYQLKIRQTDIFLNSLQSFHYYHFYIISHEKIKNNLYFFLLYIHRDEK